MALPLDKLGARPAWTATIDADQARAYARATNDDNPAYASGRLAPPVFGVVPAWDATMAALAEVMPDDRMAMLLHAGQDMRFLQPLVPGQALVTSAEPFGVRVSRAGTWVVLRVEAVDADDATPVLEQFSTMFVRGWTEAESTGPDRPDHSLPASARDRVEAEIVDHVDNDQTFRYARASGDSNPIHVDDEFARRVGLPGIILHGMCTMAMCSRAVIDGAAGGDPTRLRRLAVRFAKPVLPGSDLATTIYRLDAAGTPNGIDTGPVDTFGFESFSRGERVIRDGLAEIGR